MSQASRRRSRRAPSTVELEPLIDAWFRFLDQRPGAGPSAPGRVRLAQHLQVLRRVATPDVDPAEFDDALILVDTGSSVLPVREGFIDRLSGALARAGYPTTTRRRILGTWQQFEHWLVMEYSPAAPVAPHDTFSPDEVVALFRAARSPLRSDGVAWPVRDRALLALLLGAGLRSVELVSVKTHDFRGEPPSLGVGTARSPARRLPLLVPVGDAVAGYLGEHPSAYEGQPLFIRNDREPLCERTLHDVVNRLVRRVRPEFSGSWRMRVFRDTYIYGEIGRGVLPSIIAWRIGVRPEYLAPYVESFRSELVVDLAAALAETA